MSAGFGILGEFLSNLKLRCGLAQVRSDQLPAVEDLNTWNPDKTSTMDEKNVQGLHIDDVESNDSSRSGGVVGTVKLIDSDGVHLVPTPTNDPNGEHDVRR